MGKGGACIKRIVAVGEGGRVKDMKFSVVN